MSNTKTTLESAKHNALRYMIIFEWKYALEIEYVSVWNDLQYTLKGQSQAVMFYNVDAALDDELDFLISLAMTCKHMAEDAE
jgi:hypothetical protein